MHIGGNNGLTTIVYIVEINDTIWNGVAAVVIYYYNMSTGQTIGDRKYGTTRRVAIIIDY